MAMDDLVDFLKSKMTIDNIGYRINVTAVTGKLNPPIDKTISEIKEYFSSTEYTPIFTEEKKQHVIQFGIFKKAEEKPKYWLNLLLFLATILSTIFAGSFNSGGNPFENISDIWLGVPFSFSIMAILTCHEMGHYFTSRKAGMITTLPFFIPVPFHFLGTFGAVIKMKSIVPSRSSLLRVGMAGPIAGFLVALPITIIGISLSEVRMATEGATYLKLGDSLLFYLLGKIIHPNIPQGAEIFLHPIAFAGWLGLLVTSMNLIPIGQLDGGHVAYSVFLQRRKLFYIPLVIGLFALGIFLWVGWFVWVLLAFFLARRDPVIQDSLTPLTKREKLYALFPLIVLILTFIPKPFSFQ
jgi:membrane-associated protease RseP (regulator of RpoE activity)